MASVPTATLAEEYATLTEGCGVVDRSERGKLALTGSGAVEFLNGQVTNELVGMEPGEGRYAAFLTHKGKMLGDLRILAVGPDPDGEPGELLLDTERVALQALFDMIRRFKVGYDVELHKRTLECSLLSLIGPGAAEVAAAAFALDPSSGSSEPDEPFQPSEASERAEPEVGVFAGDDPPARAGGLSEGEHVHRVVRLGDTRVRVIRTHVGCDLLFDADALDTVRVALVDAGAVEVSEAAAEIVRVESGRPRYGLDLDETTIPQEAGLNERAVSFTKGCYVGQETVARLYYKGKPNRYLRGLRLSEPVEQGAELRLGERPVGRLGSSVLSPTFGPIGLAVVRREAEPGAILTAGEGGVTARVAELPFG
ncbi:MAG: folate-binding protein [Solirubrobacteraceae bacterium]